MRTTALFVIITLLFFVTGCKKETIVPADCQQLQNGSLSNDKDAVKMVINKFISSLTSQVYSQENLNILVSNIGQQCNIILMAVCYDCIDTNPTQSEIRISVGNVINPVEKTIDITYDSSNRMIFGNLHD